MDVPKGFISSFNIYQSKIKQHRFKALKVYELGTSGVVEFLRVAYRKGKGGGYVRRWSEHWAARTKILSIISSTYQINM